MSRHRNRDTEDAFAYFVHRAEVHGIDLSLDAAKDEALRSMADRINERAKQRFHEACDRAYRPPERGTVEVITDPTDQRGLSARRVN